MKLAPAAVFFLIAATVAKSGLDLLREPCTVLRGGDRGDGGARARRAAPGAARSERGLGVMDFLRKTGDVLMLAFSTASSSVALPVSIEAARRPPRRVERGRELRASDRRDAQQERRRGLQGGDGSVHRKFVRHCAWTRDTAHDRARIDRCGVFGRGRSGEFARDDADRTQRDRARDARRGRDRARRGG